MLLYFPVDIPDSKKETLIRTFLLLAILCTFSFLYLPMINNWFFNDDIHWIWASSTNQIKDIFFVPERARAMAPFFTPMLGISFKIDWLLFGMNPAGYSVHSILSLLAATTAFYLFIRLYTTKQIAFAGVLLFLLNPITMIMASWASSRHYIEGLFWALLSLYLFARAERKEKVSLGAGIFYLIACLNKEVYVVLPAVAFLISKETFLKRLKHTLPFWLCLGIYALWRFWIMGGIGGYLSREQISPDAVIPLFSNMMKSLSFHLFGNSAFFIVLLLFLVFLLFLKKVKLLFIFLILLIPIFPVSNLLSEYHYTGRYFFHLSVFFLFIVCLFMHHAVTKNKLIYKVAMFIMCLLIGAAFVRQDIHLSHVIKQERLQAKETAMTFIYAQKKYIKLEQPLLSFYESLRKIYRDYFGREIRTQLVPPEESLKYCDPEKLKEIKEEGIDIPYDAILASQKNFRKGPLSISMNLDHYKINWDFGPYKHKPYNMVTGPSSGLYYGILTITPSGSIMAGKNPREINYEAIYLRVIFRPDAEEGEIVSPEFVLKIPGNQTMEYSGTAVQ